MKSVLVSLLWLGGCLIAVAELTPTQIKQLEDAKKQFAAGLITQPIYEEMQRKILDLPATGSSATPQRPAARAEKATALSRLTTGHWMVKSAKNGVCRFTHAGGQLRMTRFKPNKADEPGRGEEVELLGVDIQPDHIMFDFQAGPDQEDMVEMDLGLTPEGRLECFTELFLPVTVYTDKDWHAYCQKHGAESLPDALGVNPNEIWRLTGEPDRTITADSIVVWYNAVEVPRSMLDDWGPTLRPLLIKVTKAGVITERFDHMYDAWRPVNQGRETPMNEIFVQGLADGSISQAQWDESVQKRRAADQSRGIRLQGKIPIKEGGIRRGAYPFGPKD